MKKKRQARYENGRAESKDIQKDRECREEAKPEPEAEPHEAPFARDDHKGDQVSKTPLTEEKLAPNDPPAERFKLDKISEDIFLEARTIRSFCTAVNCIDAYPIFCEFGLKTMI